MTYTCPNSCEDLIPTRDTTEYFDEDEQRWVPCEGNDDPPYCPSCGRLLKDETPVTTDVLSRDS